jgi:V-type H+-transporting ATPase subunit a
VEKLVEQSNKAAFMLFDDLESQIQEKERFIQSQVDSIKHIHESYTDMVEFKQVLNKSFDLVSGLQRKFSQSIEQSSSHKSYGTNAAGGKQQVHHAFEDDDDEESQGSNFIKEIKIGTICGTLDTAEAERFRRMIYRSTRGQVLTHFSDLDAHIKNFEGEEVQKTVYVLMFQEMESLRTRINRVCDSFNSKRFETPGTN